MPIICEHCKSEFIIKVTKQMIVAKGVYCPVCGKKTKNMDNFAKTVMGV